MATATTETSVDLNERFIPDLKLDIITYDPNNPRKHLDKAALAELADSIRQHGVVEPIVVRPHPKVKTQYMIVAGERRHRGALLAKHETIPAIIRHYSEQQACEVQQIENLQRADIHPLDEANGFKRLVDEFKYTATSIAEKIGKHPGYVARRMKLVDLIKPLQKDLTDGRLPLGHAEYLCRLPGGDQKSLMADNGMLYGYDDEVVTLRELKAAVERVLFLQLDAAPWDKTVAGPGSAPACTTCPHRSGNAALLFPEFQKEPNVCTYRDCFNLKMDAHIDEALIANPKWLLVSDTYGDPEAGVLRSGEFHLVRDKKDKCKSAQDGIFKSGRLRGHHVQVCADAKCAKHSNQIYRNTKGESLKTAEKARESRIESAARDAVFNELWRANSKQIKFDRKRLQIVALNAYERAYDRDRASKAFGWERVKNQYSSSYLPSVEAFLEKADPKDLVKFAVLLVNAHFLSSYGGGAESMKALKEATVGWGVDVDKTYKSARKEMEAKFTKKKKAVKK